MGRGNRMPRGSAAVERDGALLRAERVGAKRGEQLAAHAVVELAQVRDRGLPRTATRPRRRELRAGRVRRRGRSVSPSRTRASGPPARHSGVTWIAAGTLPDAPDMRPSVTSATWKPWSCSTPSDRRELVQLRACRWRAAPGSGPRRRSRAAARRGRTRPSPPLGVSNTSAGACTTRCSGLTAEVLMTARPRLPASSFSPPSALNGAD